MHFVFIFVLYATGAGEGSDQTAPEKPAPGKAPDASGGEQLSSKRVSALPLNKRDFSQLLLLATGTQTDTNGAAGYTNVVSKSGTNDLHGSLFEFVRNAALDARNFFDRRSIAQPGRISPFIRNESGFANGGPVVVPGLCDGRDRTFYFGQAGAGCHTGVLSCLTARAMPSVPRSYRRP